MRYVHLLFTVVILFMVKISAASETGKMQTSRNVETIVESAQEFVVEARKIVGEVKN